MLDKFNRHPSFKGIVASINGLDEAEVNGTGPGPLTPPSQQHCSGKWIRELSSMANVVVGRCARVLMVKPEELKASFEEEAPSGAKEPSKYARNLLEYCCFRALAVATKTPEHLRDKDFRRWTFDMMLAWEAPGTVNQPGAKEGEGGADQSKREPWWQLKDLKLGKKVDMESSASLEAFARMAPGIVIVADTVTVHNQFEILTAGIGGRMPFAIYNKFLIELDRTVRGIKSQTTPALASALGIVKGEEAVVETDGIATQPVLQHVGVTAWPGRLTLTDHALYFEPSGLVGYDSAKKFDLAANARHVVKPDLTGPWGARLFDKAIMYKSSITTEPIVLEFPELTGHMRRDYWLAIIREIIAVQAFVRLYRLDGAAKSQALAKSVLGIARLKAVWAKQKVLPPSPESLLTFSWADELPGGDHVLRALAVSLRAGEWGSPAQRSATAAKGSPSRDASPDARGHEGARRLSPPGGADSPRTAASVLSSSVAAAAHVAALLPGHFALAPSTGGGSPGAAGGLRASTSGIGGSGGVAGAGAGNGAGEESMAVGEVLVGEMTPLERAILQSRDSSKKMEKAKASIDEVKVDGIGTNAALMKELCIPLIMLWEAFQALARWEEPAKTIAFLAVSLYIVYRDWLGYVVPCVLLLNAALIVWVRYATHLDRRPPARRNEVVVEMPPQQSAVEQLMVLQSALAQVEAAIQGANIALLKARALLLSELPQASDELVASHVVLAVLLAVLPLRLVVVLFILEQFTRHLDFRRESNERIVRRCREWWHRIPVVPVRFVEKDDEHID